MRDRSLRRQRRFGRVMTARAAERGVPGYGGSAVPGSAPGSGNRNRQGDVPRPLDVVEALSPDPYAVDALPVDPYPADAFADGLHLAAIESTAGWGTPAELLGSGELLEPADIAGAELIGAGTPLASSRFVPEATRATWNGEVLMVTFRETGLVARTATTVSISAEAAADAVCTADARTAVSLHSHSAVADESRYQVRDGSVESTVLLRLTAGIVSEHRDDEELQVHRSYSVTLNDLDTGAGLFLRGVMQPATTTG